MSDSAICCGCGDPIRRHQYGLDKLCWKCQQSPDITADVELRGGRALREEWAGRDEGDGILFDPREGDEL